MTVKMSRPEALAILYLKRGVGARPLTSTFTGLQRKGYVIIDPRTRQWVLTAKGQEH